MSTAYDTLRGDLLAGNYQPGDRLGVEDLCNRYGIGASPLREALSRLSESGLVIALPNRGYRVASISKEEYRDLVDMRLTFEPEALRRSINNADLDWEANVAAAYQKLTGTQRRLESGAEDANRDWADKDRGFHMALLSSCGSAWMMRICGMIYDQTARYHRAQILSGIAPAKTTTEEHAALKEAALSFDAAAACSILRAHISNVASRIEAATWSD